MSGSVRQYCGTDEELLAKLTAGDLVALEAKYHAPCLASLYKKAERVKGKRTQKTQTRKAHKNANLTDLLKRIAR